MWRPVFLSVFSYRNLALVSSLLLLSASSWAVEYGKSGGGQAKHQHETGSSRGAGGSAFTVSVGSQGASSSVASIKVGAGQIAAENKLDSGNNIQVTFTLRFGRWDAAGNQIEVVQKASRTLTVGPNQSAIGSFPDVADFNFSVPNGGKVAGMIRINNGGTTTDGEWKFFGVGYADPYVRKKILLENPTDQDVVTEVIQDGQVIATFNVGPRHTGTEEIETTSQSPITYQSRAEGIGFEEESGSYVQTTGSMELGGGSIDPSDWGDDPGAGEPVSINTPLPKQIQTQTDTGAIVWTPEKSDGAAGATGPVTNATFRQGTSVLAEAIAKANGSGTGTPGNIDLSGVTSRLDTTNSRLQTANDRLQEISGHFEDATVYWKARNEDRDAAMAGAGNHAAAKADFETFTSLVTTQIQDKFASELADATGGAPADKKVEPNPSGGSWPTVQLPLGLGTMNFDPYAHSWFINALNAGREVILWILVIVFIRHGMGMAGEYAMQVSTVSQNQTSIGAEDLVPVVGKGFTYLKQGITALGIVSVIIACYGAGVGVVSTRINFLGLGSSVWSFLQSADTAVVAALNSSGPTGAMYRLMGELLPLGAMLSLLVADVMLTAFMAPLFLVASSVVRALRA